MEGIWGGGGSGGRIRTHFEHQKFVELVVGLRPGPIYPEKMQPPPLLKPLEVVLERLSREESLLIYIGPQISRLSCSWPSHYIGCAVSTHISSL